MTLPKHIDNRLKIVAAATTIALAVPAWTGFNQKASPEAVNVDSLSAIPFNMTTWRARVGPAQEALRGYVTGAPVQEEAAHPPENALAGSDDAAGPTNAAAPDTVTPPSTATEAAPAERAECPGSGSTPHK